MLKKICLGLALFGMVAFSTSVASAAGWGGHGGHGHGHGGRGREVVVRHRGHHDHIVRHGNHVDVTHHYGRDYAPRVYQRTYYGSYNSPYYGGYNRFPYSNRNSGLSFYFGF